MGLTNLSGTCDATFLGEDQVDLFSVRNDVRQDGNLAIL